MTYRYYPAPQLRQYVAARSGVAACYPSDGMQRNYERGQKRGWYAEPVADRLAVALGVHPASVWPEWFQGRDAEGVL